MGYPGSTPRIRERAKYDALMSDVGLGEYCLSLDDFSLERLLEQFQRL